MENCPKILVLNHIKNHCEKQTIISNHLYESSKDLIKELSDEKETIEQISLHLPELTDFENVKNKLIDMSHLTLQISEECTSKLKKKLAKQSKRDFLKIKLVYQGSVDAIERIKELNAKSEKFKAEIQGQTNQYAKEEIEAQF